VRSAELLGRARLHGAVQGRACVHKRDRWEAALKHLKVRAGCRITWLCTGPGRSTPGGCCRAVHAVDCHPCRWPGPLA
jgi:hypothetical protein